MKSNITNLTLEEIKEFHKNDTSLEALDYLHRLSLIPDYVKPNSIEEKYRRFLREKVEKDLEVLEILRKYSYNDGWSNGFGFKTWEMKETELTKIKRWLENE